MLNEHAKELIAKLDLELVPVAIKFSHNVPEGYDHSNKRLAFCGYLKDVQVEQKSYYIKTTDDACLGKCVLGAEPFEEKCQAGLVGFERSFWRTPAANARLYHEITTLKAGCCNYVTFSPVAECSFDPDLILFVVPTDKAALIMRATSWVSGDVWESRSSVALSCAWLYSYPYVTGKVNFCITGMHYGLARQHLYPAGLHIISVPYQKIDEMISGLDEMDWVYMAMRTDEEGKKIAQAVDRKLALLADTAQAFDFSERCRHAEG